MFSLCCQVEHSAEPSLAEIHQEMSELLDKEVNAQKEKTFGVQASSKPTKKCAMKMKETMKKRCVHNNIDRRRPFIGYLCKTCAMDINQLQVDDC